MGKIREQFIINHRGKKTAVVMPLADYQRLLEDLHDLSVVAERREEPSVPLEEVKRRLRSDGLLHD
ncbi:MAG TPA: type II toxin-antitoxin system Phd/YefM family antitoxin [Dehalococcoidia bacterium]|nr:type II toxin-antitoxin system Phd/YefM family antitoxin [Dehalococcoidia bacterium]